MRRNFDLSMGLVAIGAVTVLVSLFLHWYQPGLRAWDAFELIDWALAALSVGALVVIAGETTAAMPATHRLGWICGLVALLVIAALLDPPPAAHGAGRETGAWVALGGAAAMVTGAVLAMARISVTIDIAERDRRRRTTAVDARRPAAEPPVAPERPARASGPGDGGLWKGGRTAAETEPPGEAGTAEQPVDAEPVDDPQRTQSMPRVERDDPGD